MSKTKLVFIILSVIVCLLAISHLLIVAIQFNFDFHIKGRMTHPSMVCAFISACVINIVRLIETSPSKKFSLASCFVNLITLTLATAFTIQHPILPKVFTTLLMALITIQSAFSVKRQS